MGKQRYLKKRELDQLLFCALLKFQFERKNPLAEYISRVWGLFQRSVLSRNCIVEVILFDTLTTSVQTCVLCFWGKRSSFFSSGRRSPFYAVCIIENFFSVGGLATSYSGEFRGILCDFCVLWQRITILHRASITGWKSCKSLWYKGFYAGNKKVRISYMTRTENLKWGGWSDSNRRPSGPQPDALTNWATATTFTVHIT